MLLKQRHTEVIMRRGVIRLQALSLGEYDRGLGEIPLLGEDGAQVIANIGAIRRQRNRAL